MKLIGCKYNSNHSVSQIFYAKKCTNICAGKHKLRVRDGLGTAMRVLGSLLASNSL